MREGIPVQEPGARVIRLETDGNMVGVIPRVDGVALHRICIVGDGMIGTADNAERMLQVQSTQEIELVECEVEGKKQHTPCKWKGCCGIRHPSAMLCDAHMQIEMTHIATRATEPGEV